MRDLLEGLITKFNAKVATDAALRSEIGDLTKRVQIELRDGTKYHFTIQDHRIAALFDGAVESPDITVSTDAETLAALIRREIGPFKAYATGKLRLKGSLEDLARLRKFF